MVDWAMAGEVALSGVLGVFAVMVVLEVAIQISSAVIRRIEAGSQANHKN
ncbi:MAG: hypothetical protein H5U02_06435 [Clostridia bacterium]|nr:hypothetical protein [Clostridia bacterium]